MKRSTINALISEAIQLFGEAGFHLPPFAFWHPEDWAEKGGEAAEIRENGLGWDVTDFGTGNFAASGLLLFTLRNGNCGQNMRYPKRYAEKVMVVKENQLTPLHFHWKKREDIINRARGDLVIELYHSTPDERLSDAPVSVAVDGVRRECPAGEKVILSAGESICIEPLLYHTFHGLKGTGPVIVGEVSDVNDDAQDNRFFEPLARFPVIEEDESARFLLCTEYPPS